MNLHLSKLKIGHYILIAIVLYLLYLGFIYEEKPDIYIENKTEYPISIEFYPSGSIDSLKEGPRGYTVLHSIIDIKNGHQKLNNYDIKINRERHSLTATLKKNENINITYYRGIGGQQNFYESDLKTFFDKIVIKFSDNDSIVVAGDKSLQQLFGSSKLEFRVQ